MEPKAAESKVKETNPMWIAIIVAALLVGAGSGYTFRSAGAIKEIEDIRREANKGSAERESSIRAAATASADSACCKAQKEERVAAVKAGVAQFDVIIESGEPTMKFRYKTPDEMVNQLVAEKIATEKVTVNTEKVTASPITPNVVVSTPVVKEPAGSIVESPTIKK